MNVLSGKVAVVTGGASGIGLVMATELARQGATVVIAARTLARANEGVALAKAAAGGQGDLQALACDVSSLDSMRKAAQNLKSRYPQLHLLVNNAAVFNKERRVGDDGREAGFAVNALAPFVLSNLLLDSLKAGAPSRIVNMTMPTKTPMDFADLQSTKAFVPLKVFEMTKGGSQYLTKEMAKRTAGTGVSVVCVNPGLTKSKLPGEAPLPLRLVFKLFGKSPQKGAQVPLSACLDQQWSSGTFISDKGKAIEYPAFMTDEDCQRLWAENAAIAGIG